MDTNKLRYCIKKIGHVRSVILITSVSVAASVLLTISSMYIFSANEVFSRDWNIGIAVSIIVPLTVAPTISYYSLKLFFQLDEAEAKLKILSRMDSLTNTYTRRYILELSEQELAKAERYGYPVSLLMLDVDHFKQINDRFGHLAGDQILREIVDTIVQSIRSIDHIGRFGGEEFVILLSHTDRREACIVAERVRAAITSLVFDGYEDKISMTVSIGVATTSAGNCELDELLRIADQALYQAKEKGRNQIYLESGCDQANTASPAPGSSGPG